MAVLSLPLTFNNSFWTRDYKTGLNVLFRKLEQGVEENEQVIAYIRLRAQAEQNMASALTAQAQFATPGGFLRDDGASLLLTVRGLQSEAVTQSSLHLTLARDLNNLVASPFQQWCYDYKERVGRKMEDLIGEDGLVPRYEREKHKVEKMRGEVVDRRRKADEAEDDAKFISLPPPGSDKYTSSPQLRPTHAPRAPPNRTPSVSERIANRLRDIQKRSVGALGNSSSSDSVFVNQSSEDDASSKSGSKTVLFDEPDDDDDEPLGKRRESITSASPPPMSPPLPPSKVQKPPVPPKSPTHQVHVNIILGKAHPHVISPTQLAILLKRAESSLPLRSVRFPLIGEYQNAFTGEEVVEFFRGWLLSQAHGPSANGKGKEKESADEKSSSSVGGKSSDLWEEAEDIAKSLTEGFTVEYVDGESGHVEKRKGDGVLRRLGEIGNRWDVGGEAFEYEDNSETWYSFKDGAFDLDKTYAPTAEPHPNAERLKKTANNFASLVSSVIAGSSSLSNLGALSSTLTDPTYNPNDPPHVRLRKAFEHSLNQYHDALLKLDAYRLRLEERIEDSLKLLQLWESERLMAIKTVLLQYHGYVGTISKGLRSIEDRQAVLVKEVFNPDGDVGVMIERYRTGGFAPGVEGVAEEGSVIGGHAHMEGLGLNVVFGGDLKNWWVGVLDHDLPNSAGAKDGDAEVKVKDYGAGDKDDGLHNPIPAVLRALLVGLKAALNKPIAPEEEGAEPKPQTALEKRKAFIYEVPLAGTHHLRQALNTYFLKHPNTHPVSLSEEEKADLSEIISRYDAPIVASCIKLWLLEMEPPLLGWEAWDEIRKVYKPSNAGSGTKVINQIDMKVEDVDAEAQGDDAVRVKDICEALQNRLKLTRGNLYVLDAIMGFLRRLIDETQNDKEDDDTYICKLGLTFGRSILRPKQENELSIQDRHPALLISDLLTHYNEILPPTVQKKKRESERKVPTRKRTAMVDARLRRSKLENETMPPLREEQKKELLTKQIMEKEGMKSPDIPGKKFDLVPPPPPPTQGGIVPPPPPPPLDNNDNGFVPPPPPPPLTTPTYLPGNGEGDAPPRPSFKEPPPESDDVPRPPHFREPPPEPLSPQSVEGGDVSRSSSVNKGAALTRAPPRISKGPRERGSVSSMVANLNKRSSSGSQPDSPPGSPSYKRLSGSPRPTSPLGRGHGRQFSTRTMESDAEDVITERK